MKILKSGLSESKRLVIYHCHLCGFIGTNQEEDHLDGEPICPTEYCHSCVHCELVNYCSEENLIIMVTEFHLRNSPNPMHSTNHEADKSIKYIKRLNEDLDALRYLKEFMA